MISRRRFTQLTLAGAAASTMPLSFADNTAPVLWGPPVGPTILLALAAQNPTLQKQYPGISAKAWRGPDQLRVGLTKGTMPLTMVPSYVAANFRNQGQDVGLLNIMSFGLLYIISKTDKIKSLGDLVGKKLVMPFKQDMPDLVLRALLTKAGIDTDKIDFQYTSTPPEALMLFISGKADVALLPEPAVSMAQIKAKSLGVNVIRNLDLQSLWGELIGGKPRIPQAGLLATRAFYDQNEQLLKDLNTPLNEALKFTATDPLAAAKLSSPVMQVPPPVLAASIPYSHLSTEHATDIKDEILKFFEVLYQLNPKIVGGKMADDSLFWTMPI